MAVTMSSVTLLNAQNAIPNPGFETWTSMGSYSDPDGWGTIGDVSSGFLVTASKATAAGDFHGGTAAAKLQTKSSFAGTAPGMLATGTINQQTQAVDGGVAFNLRPVAVTGWFKYTPVSIDTASVDVTLSKWNTTTLQRDVVGHAKFWSNTTTSSYTQFTEAFTYSSSDVPDTMVVIILSSNPHLTSANANSTLFIDDLAFDMSTGVSEHNSDASLTVYPNPNAGSFNIAFNTKVNDTYKIELRNALGQLVYQEIIPYTSGEYTKQMDVNQYGKGIYTMSMVNAAGTVSSVKKVAVY